jgi:hypothetical protein
LEALPRFGGVASNLIIFDHPVRQSLTAHQAAKPRQIQSAVKPAHSKMSPSDLWHFFPLGYLFTILIETLILLLGLSKRHSIKRRILAGVWLTACTYPIVVLVMPIIFANRVIYLTVAETFAPVAECILFWLAYGASEEFGKRSMWQDFATIVVANLASFIGGEVLNAYGWFGLLS